MRLAWFTPWPPDPSGVAGRSAAVVARLAARGHALDVFVDEARVPTDRAGDGAPARGAVRVQGAHEFVWRVGLGQYDLPVYQLGNSRLHEFIWPYAFRWPGLVVLHDARLHHARGRALLLAGQADRYRREFEWNQPDVRPEAAELAIHGFDGPYFYLWPMTRRVLSRARLTAVHAAGSVPELRRTSPDEPVVTIALGEGRDESPTDAERRAWRAEFGLDRSAPVVGVFGGLTLEKRIPQILRAWKALARRHPNAVLLLAGTPDPSLGLSTILQDPALAPTVRLLPELDDDAFDRAIATVDVSLNLRWPSAHEVSGPWLRALAMARATIILDLPHLATVPSLDPRTWDLHRPRATADAHPRAVAVAIDVLDEDHSLGLALTRLVADPDLCGRIGRAARAYWEAHHTTARMVDDYERVLGRALTTPAPGPDSGRHLEGPDPFDEARRLLTPFGPRGVTTIGDMLTAPSGRGAG